MNGEKKSVPRKQIAVTTAVNPVLPPASTPVADSMKAPEVDVPTKAAKITESASTVIGRSICGKLLIQKSRACRHSNQRTHRVHEGHNKNREHNREESPAQCSSKIHAEQYRRNAGRQAHPRFWRSCHASYVSQKRVREDADQNVGE